MAKQMIKGLTMFGLIVTLAFVSAVASQAQSSRRQVADIPFDFTVGNKNLPAGQYHVAPMTSSGDALRISDPKTAKSAIRLTTAVSKMQPVEKGKLVFRRYGNRYFLAEVWNAGYSSGQRLLKSSAEKAIERELAAVAFKTHSELSRPETIEVALVGQ